MSFNSYVVRPDKPGQPQTEDYTPTFGVWVITGQFYDPLTKGQGLEDAGRLAAALNYPTLCAWPGKTETPTTAASKQAEAERQNRRIDEMEMNGGRGPDAWQNRAPVDEASIGNAAGSGEATPTLPFTHPVNPEPEPAPGNVAENETPAEQPAKRGPGRPRANQSE